MLSKAGTCQHLTGVDFGTCLGVSTNELLVQNIKQLRAPSPVSTLVARKAVAKLLRPDCVSTFFALRQFSHFSNCSTSTEESSRALQ